MDYKIHTYNINQSIKYRNTKKYQLKERQKQRFLEDVSIEIMQRQQMLQNLELDLNSKQDGGNEKKEMGAMFKDLFSKQMAKPSN